ncbi:MAG: hypothetical protein HKN42_02055 [Granulosicoccus sp.]|nr:hypothetical protein [Granulosicoccus sp.]
MRPHKPGGEKLFIGYCGLIVEITDQRPGELKLAQVFVAVPGVSKKTYAEATLS